MANCPAPTTLPTDFFASSHLFDYPFQETEAHQKKVVSSCVPIMVTPEELASTVRSLGVNSPAAKDLITRLIARAQHEAIAATLGISSEVESSE